MGRPAGRYAAEKARIEYLYAIADREVAPAKGDPEVIFCVDLCRSWMSSGR